MTGEEILKKWKHKAPKGATHCLIIPARDNLCWFVGKNFNQACRPDGVVDFVYDSGLSYLREMSKERDQKLLPLYMNLENK